MKRLLPAKYLSDFFPGAGDISRAEQGGGGASATASVLAGAPEGSGPPEGSQEEEAGFWSQVSKCSSCSEHGVSFSCALLTSDNM